MSKREIAIATIVACLVLCLTRWDLPEASGRGDAPPNIDVWFAPHVLPESSGWGAKVLEDDAMLTELLRAEKLAAPFTEFLNRRHQERPNWTVTEAISGELSRARKEIRVAMFALTSTDLADTLVRAHRSGRVRVRVVLDTAQAEGKFSEQAKDQVLKDAGIEVRLIGDPKGGWNEPKMHDKFAVVDDLTVLTGSYNWTVAADQTNHENLIMIRNDPLTVAKFLAEFDWLWHYAGTGGAGPKKGR